MRARSLSATLAMLSIVSATTAWAGPWLPAPGEYSNEFTGRRSLTDQFRDAGGTKGPIPGDYQVESRGLGLTTELGWKERWSIVLGLPLESRSQRYGRPFYQEATQTGFGDLRFGVRYGLLAGANALALEGDWDAPLGYDRKAVPVLGDGQQKLGGQAIYGAGIPSLNGFVEVSGGARYLAEDKKVDVVFGAVAGFWVGRSILVSATYDGFSGDSLSRHTVGPEVRLRVDDRLDVFAGSRHTIAGENVLDAAEFRFGFAFKKTKLNRLQGFLGGTSRP